MHPGIGRGLLRREPQLDWLPAKGVIPDATPDPEVLRIAAESGRVLVSRDVGTMSRHFAAFVARSHSPGVILVPPAIPIGVAIEKFLLVWLFWSAEDLENQVWWLP